MISQRYERGATLITSNLPFDQWTETFGLLRRSPWTSYTTPSPIRGPLKLGIVAQIPVSKILTRSGQEIELAPEHYAPVSDRDVLLRLQNNLKSRLLQAGRYERALGIVETMLMLAPDMAELWQEAGVLHARQGNIRASVNALQEFVTRAPEGTARHQAAAMLQQLKSKLN